MRSLLRSAAAGVAATLAGASAVIAGEPAAAALKAPCVVELFTSQGCSSCPKADALLARIAMQDGVIALSVPVDYWDYLGWKDTLAQPAFSARQKGYAAARGDAHVYTPQVVVSGAAHAVGSDPAAIARASQAAAAAGAMSVPVRLTGQGDRIEVGAAAPDGPRRASVYAMRVERAHTVEIGRGENRNRAVTYTNVVRAVARVGAWEGAARSYETPASLARGPGEALVVLLQAGEADKPGVVLGAAMSR